MERTFNNREGDKPCYICGELVLDGQESTWDRTPAKRGKAHITCLAARNIAERAGATAPAPKPQTSGSWLEGLAEQLIPHLENKLQTKLDGVEDLVRNAVAEELDGAILVKTHKIILETKKDDGTTQVKDLGIQHKQFPALLNLCRVRHEDDSTRLNILLTGPAGTGKTRAAREIAKALDLPFYFTGAINTEYKLLGFIDAQGRVINPAFRKAWTGGGAFLFDEVWRSLPAALMPFNTALSGTLCDFPDGCFERHPDFLCIAADNTYGLGGDTKYTGHKQDASVLDRFVKYRWEIDEALEEHIAQHPDWCKRIRQLRANARRQGLDVLITPRAARDGASMLRQGIPQHDVEALLVRNGMTDQQWSNIQ
jgi:hypothetical protein